MNGSLNAPVERFVRALRPVLEEVGSEVGAGVERARLAQDVVVEASSVVAAFLDADGRQSDDELWAYIAAFGPRFDTDLVRATPADVRRARLVEGKARWLEGPSPLLEVLLDYDRVRGSSHARTYYDEAMRLAHITVALDAYPAPLELEALERFRSMLLAAMPPDSSGASSPTPRQASTSERSDETASTEVSPAPLAPPRPIDELLAELDALVGLHAVKAEVKIVTALLRVQKLRAEAGLGAPESSRHLVFTGNPGTGKTTVARLLAEIYRTLGVVERGHLVETDRSGLVMGYVGQTAKRVVEVFDTADEGVLLIDEAYALARGGANDFGREAIDTLVKLVEDRRDRIVVIVAGYPEEMDTFVRSNPGLESRFPRTIHFPDYSDDELVAIVELLAERHHYAFTDEALERVRQRLTTAERGKGFGNGRLARNVFEQAIAGQAQRLVAQDSHTVTELQTIEASDVALP